MSPVKIVTLLTYSLLAVLAYTEAGSAVGVWSLRILLILAAVHLVEVVVFFKVCRSAGGSLPLHHGFCHTESIDTVADGLQRLAYRTVGQVGAVRSRQAHAQCRSVTSAPRRVVGGVVLLR